MRVGEELTYIYYYKLSSGKFICVDYGKSDTFSMISDIMMGETSNFVNKTKENEFDKSIDVYDELENTVSKVELRIPNDTIRYFHFFYGGDIICCPNYYLMRKEEFIMLSRKEDGFKNFTDFQLWYFIKNIDLKGLLFYLEIEPIFEYDINNGVLFMSSRKLGNKYEIKIPSFCSHIDYIPDKVSVLNTTIQHKQLVDEQTIIFKPYEISKSAHSYHLNLVLSTNNVYTGIREKVDKDISVEMKFSEFAEMLRTNSRAMMLQTVEKGVIGS